MSCLTWLIFTCLINVGVAFSITPGPHIVYDIIEFTPTDIHLSETAKLYAQVSWLGSGIIGVHSVNFIWYVNSTEVLTENATSSTLIYKPQAVGIYLINATVNGYSNGQVVTVTVLSEPTESPTAISPTPTVPELSWLIILPLILSIFSVIAILRHRKTVN